MGNQTQPTGSLEAPWEAPLPFKGPTANCGDASVRAVPETLSRRGHHGAPSPNSAHGHLHTSPLLPTPSPPQTGMCDYASPPPKRPPHSWRHSCPVCLPQLLKTQVPSRAIPVSAHLNPAAPGLEDTSTRTPSTPTGFQFFGRPTLLPAPEPVHGCPLHTLALPHAPDLSPSTISSGSRGTSLPCTLDWGGGVFQSFWFL